MEIINPKKLKCGVTVYLDIKYVQLVHDKNIKMSILVNNLLKEFLSKNFPETIKKELEGVKTKLEEINQVEQVEKDKEEAKLEEERQIKEKAQKEQHLKAQTSLMSKNAERKAFLAHLKAQIEDIGLIEDLKNLDRTDLNKLSEFAKVLFDKKIGKVHQTVQSDEFGNPKTELWVLGAIQIRDLLDYCKLNGEEMKQ